MPSLISAQVRGLHEELDLKGVAFLLRDNHLAETIIICAARVLAALKQRRVLYHRRHGVANCMDIATSDGGSILSVICHDNLVYIFGLRFVGDLSGFHQALKKEIDACLGSDEFG